MSKINYMIHNSNAIDSINKTITKLTECDTNIIQKGKYTRYYKL